MNWHNQPMEKDATLNGRRICIAQPHQESESWTLAKSRAKLVVLTEYKIKGKKASTAGVHVNPVKLRPIANGVIGIMESVQRPAEEEREQITERYWFISQMEEKLALVQLGNFKIAT